ncbi:hypothetical protein QAD02_021632 [Eretmocerus hayati]|uniref:Uncharacterized protein n=1 Tax=Eretmocerus hayati TaxID=131215 RepID=A0ACC2PQG8_9HYME|nr:hypothetical protein QAD02_021632 [Eretmocerus hayati]
MTVGQACLRNAGHQHPRHTIREDRMMGVMRLAVGVSVGMIEDKGRIIIRIVQTIIEMGQLEFTMSMIGVGDNMTTIIVTSTVTIITTTEIVIVMVVMEIGVATRSVVQIKVVMVTILGVAMDTTIIEESTVNIMEEKIAESTIGVSYSGIMISSASSRITTPEAMEMKTHMNQNADVLSRNPVLKGGEENVERSKAELLRMAEEQEDKEAELRQAQVLVVTRSQKRKRDTHEDDEVFNLIDWENLRYNKRRNVRKKGEESLEGDGESNETLAEGPSEGCSEVADEVGGGLMMESAEEVTTSCTIHGGDGVEIEIAKSGTRADVAGAGGSARSSNS